MQFASHQSHGVIVRAHVLDKDERISRRSSPFEYSASVINGRARVFEFTVPNHTISFEMKPNQEPESIPAFMEHEILSLEDGTVVLNVSAA